MNGVIVNRWGVQIKPGAEDKLVDTPGAQGEFVWKAISGDGIWLTFVFERDAWAPAMMNRFSD